QPAERMSLSPAARTIAPACHSCAPGAQYCACLRYDARAMPAKDLLQARGLSSRDHGGEIVVKFSRGDHLIFKLQERLKVFSRMRIVWKEMASDFIELEVEQSNGWNLYLRMPFVWRLLRGETV